MISDDANDLTAKVYRDDGMMLGWVGIKALERIDEWWEVDVGTAMMAGMHYRLRADLWQMKGLVKGHGEPV